MDILFYILAGAGVGLAVGLTGVGGGSLMTPLLLMFGFPPHIAIGTDLIYAAITKGTGVYAHHRQQTIIWPIVRRLLIGCVPASLAAIVLLSVFFTEPEDYRGLLVSTLGAMLILTSVVLIFRPWILKHRNIETDDTFLVRHQKGLTVLSGVFLGFAVTLSSVGAGAFGTAILMMLYPHLSGVKIVGTDLAYAVPLTFLAGMGHWHLGNIDWYLLGALLIGSIPAIQLGTRLARKLPNRVLQSTLAGILLLIGLKYTFF
ncbi:sulfite exporter TauE/SafE family protein [Marinobacter nanhaiticus D15-8W]|uniref:Probable membrane transporter protein n=1 Tax=Marinobacter nanhaiticus D15-8W TaxID=626887 RepID=N6WRT9_9GAMM|nr:sulfite exporter TauE/SafE family protein [Marinobacter nanhaiticus]ENO14246.1 sulfite exporter TauE/SafE family protein [Marinobacter nanhaiticus D15-8W]